MTAADDSQDRKTPVDQEPNLDPIAMLSKKLDDVAADTKLAVTEAREAKGHSIKTYDLQLELNERTKSNERRIKLLEATRFWLPVLSILIAIAAFARTFLR